MLKRIFLKNNNGYIKLTFKNGKTFKWNKKVVFQNSKNNIEIIKENSSFIKILFDN